MTHSSINRTKRCTVLTVLMVWMFALGVGWFAACHVQGHAADNQVATNGAFLAVGAFVPLDHGLPGDGKGAPLEDCDDGPGAIVKSSTSVDSIFVAMSPPVAPDWSVQLSAAAAEDFLPARLAPGPQVPLRTRYSRLVL